MDCVRRVADLLHSSLELLLPDVCRVCGTLVEGTGRHQGLCAECLLELKFIGLDVCCRCGTPFSKGVTASHHCSDCLLRLPSYDRAVSITEYDRPVRELLRRLKYRADTRVLPALATIYGLAEKEESMSCDCIIPVPLYPGRLRKRGLNQSLHLARILFPDKIKCIRPTALQRVRNTQPQTGLDGAARRKNLKSAFRVAECKAVSGREIVLVDDVYTTGTTVEECSRTLKQAGAAKVQVVTFARVILDR